MKKTSTIAGTILFLNIFMVFSFSSIVSCIRSPVGNDFVPLDSIYIPNAADSAEYNRQARSIRKILDTNELTMIYVEDVTTVSRGRITKLRLTNLPILFIPPVFDSLTELIELEISHTPLRTLPAGIGQLKKLTSLKLFMNRLDSLPSDIGACTSLVTLYVHGNNLTRLPASIGNLSKVQTITAFNNYLDSLPQSITVLHLSNNIQINNNCLCSVPESTAIWLDREEYNRELWRETQRCDSLSQDINSMKAILTYYGLDTTRMQDYAAINGGRITAAYLSGLQTDSLPAPLFLLTGLKQLHLDSNNFSRIPSSLKNLTKLELLNLSNNNLDSTSKIDSLTALRDLRLAYNSFTGMMLGHLPSLSSLDISHNMIDTIDHSIGDYVNLSFVNMSSNSISFLPDTLFQKKLKVLVGGNRLCNLSVVAAYWLTINAEAQWDSLQTCTP